MSTFFAAILTSRPVVALAYAARGNAKTDLDRQTGGIFPEQRHPDDPQTSQTVTRPIDEQTCMLLSHPTAVLHDIGVISVAASRDRQRASTSRHRRAID